MWWMSKDGKRQINLDSVCLMEAVPKGTYGFNKDCVLFGFENRPGEVVDVASLDEAKAMLRSIHNALRHEDEQRHGAVHHCSVCMEGCEEAEK